MLNPEDNLILLTKDKFIPLKHGEHNLTKKF